MHLLFQIKLSGISQNKISRGGLSTEWGELARRAGFCEALVEDIYMRWQKLEGGKSLIFSCLSHALHMPPSTMLISIRKSPSSHPKPPLSIPGYCKRCTDLTAYINKIYLMYKYCCSWYCISTFVPEISVSSCRPRNGLLVTDLSK